MTYQDYYKALLEMFGHADYSGCYLLAQAIAKHTPTCTLQDIYSVIATEFDTTLSAVERNIRVYLNAILTDYSIEDVGTVLNYTFGIGQTKIRAAEFIPVFKILIDERNKTTQE